MKIFSNFLLIQLWHFVRGYSLYIFPVGVDQNYVASIRPNVHAPTDTIRLGVAIKRHLPNQISAHLINDENIRSQSGANTEVTRSTIYYLWFYAKKMAFKWQWWWWARPRQAAEEKTNNPKRIKVDFTRFKREWEERKSEWRSKMYRNAAKENRTMNERKWKNASN